MIPEKFTYLFVDFFTLLFPLIFSFTRKFDFKNYWKFYFPVNITIAFLYILWDTLYTSWGVWGFDLKYTLGITIFNLPIEEILFFVCIPYACIFTYYCFRKYIFPRITLSLNVFWKIGAFLFFLLGCAYPSLLYTMAAFFSCAIVFLLIDWFNMVNPNRTISFTHFLLFYILILIPFYIFNGILTGSFLNRVVVFYNDSENLGIRILTVPFEDIFYGMGLILAHILGFEYYIAQTSYKERDQNVNL